MTGSANISSLSSVQESLAGRLAKLRLRTISQGEILGNDGIVLINRQSGRG